MSVYVSKVRMGSCKRCKKYEDLRMEVCFPCSKRVMGKVIPGGFEFWDIDDLDNRWEVKDE